MLFINCDNVTGLSINSYRKPHSLAGDIGDLAEAYQIGLNCVCPLEGAEATLCDGFYWQGSDITSHTIEDIYNFIQDWRENNGQ